MRRIFSLKACPAPPYRSVGGSHATHCFGLGHDIWNGNAGDRVCRRSIAVDSRAAISIGPVRFHEHGSLERIVDAKQLTDVDLDHVPERTKK